MKYVIDEEELNEHIFSKLTYWLKSSSQLDDIIVNRGKCADDITESFLKSKTPVEDKQYEHIGYLEVHFSESASFEDNIRPVIALQTLTDCVKHKDGRYKIYIEVIK